MKLDSRKQAVVSDSKPGCALRGHCVSFGLVGEVGVGTAYGGLPYTVYDSAGQQYKGRLNGDGFAKLQDIYCGPVVLVFDDLYSGAEQPYQWLMERSTYKLPITELQARAEQTRFAAPDGRRLERNPAQQQANRFHQVEVRD